MCPVTTPQSSTPWQQRFSLERPSWRRHEVLDLVHVVDDVCGVLRRVRLVEGARPLGEPVNAAYEASLLLMDTLHEVIRRLPQPPPEPRPAALE